MRLAIIRQDYAPEARAEQGLEAALEALLERNVAVTLYTREAAPTRLQLIEQVACDPFHVGRLWRDAGFARAACRMIGRARANLVEAHQPLPCCDVYRADSGVLASWFDEERAGAGPLARARLAASLHWRYLLAVERSMYANPWLAAVICPSPLVRDEVQQRFGLAADRLHVIPPAVDVAGISPALSLQRTATLERHGIDPARTVFLFASSDWRRDGAGIALEAIARAGEGVHLLLLGEPAAPHVAARLLERHGAAGRATLVGQPDDPRTYLGAADAFVQPAAYDPRPTAVLDAMAAGLPPIVTERSGAAALVRAHDAGIVVPPRDAAALAAAMTTLAARERRGPAATAARAAVLPYSPAAVTLKAVLLYRDLLAATVRARPAPAGSP